MAPAGTKRDVQHPVMATIPSGLRQRRASLPVHKRQDSDGSTIGAFSAKPIVLARVPRKRRQSELIKGSGPMPTTTTPHIPDHFDLMSASRLAIEKEGGQDRVAGLIWHPLEESQEKVVEVDETTAEERLPIHSHGVTHPPFFVYGTMPDRVERGTSDATMSLRGAAIQDDSVHSGSGADRFFSEENAGPFSMLPNRSSADMLSHESLRYSEYSADTGSDTRRSSLYENILTSLRTSFSSITNKLNASSNARQNGQGFFETTRKKKPGIFYGRLQEPIDENTPELVWPPMSEPEKMGPQGQRRRSVVVNVYESLTRMLDPIPWLEADAILPSAGEEVGVQFPEDKGHRTLRGLARTFFFNPAYPEFTSLQQFVWSIIIGVAMGVYTAVFKYLIDGCVDFNWVAVPAFLKKVGFFTDRDGLFPMVHYMWLCPTFYGCSLSYIFAALSRKIPTQNEWIQNLHSKGVQDCATFWQLIFLSTLGMASGLSLGPELPLILTAGMAGSYLGILTRQSVLQARVLNLVAASSAVGGFFGFPMAAALFVLEMPHRMGLQYFEALSPAIFGSIVAVLTNRMLIKNDVTGYYNYPFLTDSLPSTIFWHAIIFGIYGAAVGIGYAKAVLKLKDWVHGIFHFSSITIRPVGENNGSGPATKPVDEEHGFPMQQELTPLMIHKTPDNSTRTRSAFDRFGVFVNQLKAFSIRREPLRAAVSGAIAGFLVGITCMFVPHSLFWGEAQLQNIIDKGRSPLPIFGRGDDPTADLTAWAFCMIDPDKGGANEYSLSCSALIGLSKIFVTGLSVGTGIIGGHFWGPLFTGCIASHFFTDLARMVGKYFGFDPIVATYPCVAILCTMGASHVVTFRAHTSIMLILTLTISAFTPEDSTTGFAAGNYSAVFPLLVVAVYVSLMISRDFVKFYPAQRSRGDIMALPEALCEPCKAGAPMFAYYSAEEDESYFTSSDEGSTEAEDSDEKLDALRNDNDDADLDGSAVSGTRTVGETIEHGDADSASSPDIVVVPGQGVDRAECPGNTRSVFRTELSSSRLQHLLSTPIPETIPISDLRTHRRVRSASDSASLSFDPTESVPGQRRSRTTYAHDLDSIPDNAGSVSSKDLGRVYSFGEILDFQPSLLDQARSRASSRHHLPRRRARSQPRSDGHVHRISTDS